MDAHIEHQWETGEYVICLREKGRSGDQTYFTVAGAGGELVGHTVTRGAAIEVMMRLPREAVEALAKALSTIPVPSQATSLHLQDSIAVRDRLLQIVERMTGDGGMPAGATRGPI